jgi:alpha-1,6-mannosyltransferase
MTRLAPRGWRLAIAGSGPLAPTLAAAPGLTVLGFERERLPALYASCDGFVHPSPIEAFGLSVLEALASGAPVVGSAHGGVAELLPPWCPRSRACPAALAAAVEQAAALGRPAAARAVAERYPWAATAERVLALHGAVRQAAPLACSAAAR